MTMPDDADADAEWIIRYQGDEAGAHELDRFLRENGLTVEPWTPKPPMGRGGILDDIVQGLASGAPQALVFVLLRARGRKADVTAGTEALPRAVPGMPPPDRMVDVQPRVRKVYPVNGPAQGQPPIESEAWGGEYVYFTDSEGRRWAYQATNQPFADGVRAHFTGPSPAEGGAGE